jgi:hypothetical protein
MGKTAHLWEGYHPAEIRRMRSPWVRGAPQRGFSLLIFRIISRTSLEVSGLPMPCRLLFQVQNRRKPLRCHAITVSGLTMTSAERHAGQKRETKPTASCPMSRVLACWEQISNDFACFQTVASHLPVPRLHVGLGRQFIRIDALSMTQCSVRFRLDDCTYMCDHMSGG